MGILEDKIARRFAETMLYWNGEMRASDIMDYLGVSERTARQRVSDWRHGNAILPDFRPGSMRSLTPIDEFTPSTEVMDPRITLALLMTADYFPANPFSSYPPVDGAYDLSLSAVKTRTETLRLIVKACIRHEAVFLIYLAKSGIQEFVFSPSALVRARGRYHLRGYRSNGQDSLYNKLEDRYVDVVLSRAIDAQLDSEFKFIDLGSDHDWHKYEQYQFALSPNLTKEETLCYEHEYGISDQRFLRVKERRALMPYICQELFQRLCWRQDGTSVKIWSEPKK